VGDTPVIGSGVFADNEICALSTTGHGESILLSMLSGFIVSEMRTHLRRDPRAFENSPDLLGSLLKTEVTEMDRKAEGKGGAIIVIPVHGEPAYAFNSEMVSLGLRTGTTARVERSEVFVEHRRGERFTMAPKA
jgi:beta-aspartyl-peptidase (threonine type)